MDRSLYDVRVFKDKSIMEYGYKLTIIIIIIKIYVRVVTKLVRTFELVTTNLRDGRHKRLSQDQRRKLSTRRDTIF
jgi:hypothetical protein